MRVFLIQTSATAITNNAEHAAASATTGPRFCDDILEHHTYVNASPYWKEEGFDRHTAWQRAEAGDIALLYCTSSVEEYGASLSHVLPIEEKEITDEGALLRFEDAVEITPKLDYQEIHRLADQGRLSDRMRYCGQQGFNFTEVEPRDFEAITERSSPVEGTWNDEV